jgi:large subunit ribosomal protein L17
VKHRMVKNNMDRTPAHRKAMMRNMVMDLFWWTTGHCSRANDREHGGGGGPRVPHRIRTTIVRAKMARRLAEKLITLARTDSLHARRRASSILGGTDKARKVVKILFNDIAPRFMDRPGGYTRIIRLPQQLRLPESERTDRNRRQYGRRIGDAASMVFLELVTGTVAQKHDAVKQ